MANYTKETWENSELITAGKMNNIEEGIGDKSVRTHVIATDALTFPVSKGTLCIHEQKLYKANQDISTSESWTSAHWTETNLDLILKSHSNDFETIIAPLYSSLTFPIYQGEYCTYDNKLYEALQDISTSEAWTAAHWAQVEVIEIIKDSVEDINSLLRAHGINAQITYPSNSEGKYIMENGTIGNNVYFHYSDYIGVVEGDYMFSRTSASLPPDARYCRIHGYTAAKVWSSQLAAASLINGLKEITFTVPSGIKYIRFSVPKAGTYTEKLEYLEVPSNLAPNFSVSTSYEVGDWVTYQNKLYKFIMPHAAGAWNSAQVEAASITGELDKKANNDGYYENLTSGSAEQLLATQVVEDNEIYSFRASGGATDIGDRANETVVGGCIAWNQLAINGNFTSTDNWIKNSAASSFTVSNNVATIVAASDNVWPQIVQDSHKYLSGHKYLAMADIHYEGGGSVAIVLTGCGATTKYKTLSDSYERCSFIYDATSTVTNTFVVTAKNTSVSEGDVIHIKNVQLFDLTQMFGITIANYINSLETANAGAGVAWFTKLFPKTYYAYNSGEIMSVRPQKHINIGFNQWDEKWEKGTITLTTGENDDTADGIRAKNYIPILPNTKYYITVTSAPTPSVTTMKMRYYDENYNYLGTGDLTVYYNSEFTTPAGVCYFKFSTQTTYGNTYNNDICLNLSHSSYRNGEYEAFKGYSYSLDSNLELNGVPQLDTTNNKVYYDGDIYESVGKVTRRFKKVVIDGTNKTLTSVYGSGENALPAYQSTAFPLKSFNIIADNAVFFPTNVTSDFTSNFLRASITYNVIGVYINGIKGYGEGTDYPTSAELRAAANTYLQEHPITIVYETTPIEETALPYTSPQIVDDFGTEHYIDAVTRDINMPVGHMTKYPANLRDKLQHLPSLAEVDGDYIIRQNGTQMALTPALTVDTGLNTSGKAADAKAAGDSIKNAKDGLTYVENTIFEYTEGTVYSSPTGWRLNESDGCCTANNSYKFVKYKVVAGNFIKVVSDDRFQFQSAESVKSSAPSNRVGDTTYGAGTFNLVVPVDATWLVISTPISGSIAKAYMSTSVTDLANEVKTDLPSFAPNSTCAIGGNTDNTLDMANTAFYRSGSDTAGKTTVSGCRAVCVALADIDAGIVIDYSNFTGSSSQDSLMFAEGGEVGSTLDAYWGAVPTGTFNYGIISGNLVYVDKAKVQARYATTTHIFITMSAVSGSVKNYVWRDSKSVIEQIEDLHDAVFPTVPLKVDGASLTESDLTTAKGKLNALGRHDFEFAWQTDTHLFSKGAKANQLNLVSTANIGNPYFIVNGGDLINGGYYPRAVNKMSLANAVGNYKQAKCDYLQLFGNHDDNSLYYITTPTLGKREIIGYSDWFNMVDMRLADYNVALTTDKRYFSRAYEKDIGGSPYRFLAICLDSGDVNYETDAGAQYIFGFKEEQLKWLIDTLIYSSYSEYVMVFVHCPIDGVSTQETVHNLNLIKGIIEAFANHTSYSGISSETGWEASVSCDFTGKTTQHLVGVFQGHTHADSLVTANNVNYVTLDCGFVGSSDPESKVDAIDYVNVNISTKTVNLIRLGGGNGVDRTFTFA